MHVRVQKLRSLPQSSHCDITHHSFAVVAAADRRVRAMPDGGRFTAFPPVVRRAATAVPTAQDVRLDAERWGGSGGGGCRSWRERDWRAEDGGPDSSWFFVIYADSPPHQLKNGTGTYLRGFLR